MVRVGVGDENAVQVGKVQPQGLEPLADAASSRRALQIRRQEMPASTKMFPPSQLSASAFPEEPLARVCTVVNAGNLLFLSARR